MKARIKNLWDNIMSVAAFVLMPFAIIFFLVIMTYCRDLALKFINGWKALMNFDFVNLTLDPPRGHGYTQEYGCALYGLHGTLTEYGNEMVRKISGNCLSFYVGKKEDEFVCFLVAADGPNSPYRHLLMTMTRKNAGYPITINTHTGKRYEEIKSDTSLKIAVREILQSNETKSLMDAMVFIFWGQYQLPADMPTRDALVSTHGEEFVKRYEELVEMRSVRKLISEKDRDELVKMHQAISPNFGTEIGEHGSSDLDRLFLTPLLART